MSNLPSADDGYNPHVTAAADRFVAASHALADRSFWPIRIFTNANLFLWHLEVFAGDNDPTPRMVDVLDRATSLLQDADKCGVCLEQFPPIDGKNKNPDDATGLIFGDIYAPISDREYFTEAYETLKTRLERNGVDPRRLFGGKVVFDAGCGIGKYSAAMAQFGAARVVGLDLTEEGVNKARAQASKIEYGERLSYFVGSVTDIPIMDGSVDLVWCNSVLHLVDRPMRGIQELARVLKPGGRAFVYVNGRFGLLELLVRTLYAANQGLPRSLFQHVLVLCGMNPGRIAWIVGFTFANYRFMPQAEVEKMLKDAGFVIESRLDRGIATDYSEQLAAGLPYGRIKYGEGKLNYLVRKI